MNLIIKARDFARKSHAGQKRKYSGDPYHYHLDRVTGRVLSLDYSTEDMICAAELHDTIEDCKNITWEILSDEFSMTIADIVRGLTSYSKQMDSQQSRKLRKAMDHNYLAIQSKEVKIIKLIDRIDNLQDMGSNDLEFQRLYLRESEDLLKAIQDGNKQLAIELGDLIASKYDFLNGV